MKTNMKRMRTAIVDAFTDRPYSGNGAGVVLLENDPFPEDAHMVCVAAELRCSETAFVRRIASDEFAVRYFTPVCEAALCGLFCGFAARGDRGTDFILLVFSEHQHRSGYDDRFGSGNDKTCHSKISFFFDDCILQQKTVPRKPLWGIRFI